MRGEVAVIGGGIAGVLSARLLAQLGYEVTLFEKSGRLGGCAGSFLRGKFPFNIAATTIGGLFPGFPVERIFRLLCLCPQERVSLAVSVPTFWIKANEEEAYLTPFEEDLLTVLINFCRLKPKPAKKLLKDIKFSLSGLFHDPYFHLNGAKSKLKTLLYLTPLILNHGIYYRKSALPYLKEITQNDIHPLTLKLFNALSLITAQAPLEEVSVFTLHLALGYSLTGVGTVKEGNEALFSYLADGFDFFLNTPVEEIGYSEKEKVFILKVGKERLLFERVVSAIPVLENYNIFSDDLIRKYLRTYEKLVSPFSAITLYGVIKNYEPKATHCLLLTAETFDGYTSGNYLVSFLPVNLEGGTIYSFTLSTHTPIEFWRRYLNDKESYRTKKEELSKGLKKLLLSELSLEESQLEIFDLATPITFNYYLNRMSLGGIPVTLSNSIWKVPGNISPRTGLYLLSDQTLFYQGWIGISLGLLNLYRWWEDAGF